MYVLVRPADLEVDVSVTVDRSNTKDAALYVSMKFDFDDLPVEWALVLTGAYANAIAEASAPIADAAAPAHGEMPATYIRAVDVKPATRIAGANREPVSVVAGSATVDSSVYLTVPTSIPVTHDLGDRWSLDLPVFGSDPYDDSWNLAALNPEGLPGNVRQLLATERVWSRPTTRWTFALDQRADERLDAAFPAPAGASDWRWSAVDLLDIDAIIGRPTVQVERESYRFFSGLLLGLAGGVLIWIFELVRDAARRRSARDRSS